MKTIFAFLAILILAALTFPCAKAETTFFDNPNDAFVMADANATNGTTGGTTGDGHSSINLGNQNESKNMTVGVVPAKPPYTVKKPAGILDTIKAKTSEIKTQVVAEAVPLSVTGIGLIMIIVAFMSWKVIKSKKRTI